MNDRPSTPARGELTDTPLWIWASNTRTGSVGVLGCFRDR